MSGGSVVTRSKGKKGFSLIEMMIAVGVIGLLVSIGQPMYVASQIRARRVESVVNLEALEVAQFSYYATHDQFAPAFDDLDFRVNGARATGTVFHGKRYTMTLSQPWGQRSWYCSAAAELDGDPWPDMMVSYERL